MVRLRGVIDPLQTRGHMTFEHHRTFGVACVLLSLCVAGSAAQGVGLPPLFDTSARNVQNTLQVEGAVISSGAAAYDGSVGLRFRRDFSAAALTAGVGVLSDGGFGYALSIAGQLKPGRWVIVDGAEKALAISA